MKKRTEQKCSNRSGREWADYLRHLFATNEDLRDSLMSVAPGTTSHGILHLDLIVPPEMPDEAWGSIERTLLTLLTKQPLQAVKDMILRRPDATGQSLAGAYRLSWADGASVVTNMLRGAKTEKTAVHFTVSAYNSEDQYCPSGCAVVDAVSDDRGLLLPAPAMLNEFHHERMRFISECDVCHDEEHDVTVDGTRLCVACLHGDDVATVRIPLQLDQMLLRMHGLRKARLVFARNHDGDDIALTQHHDGKQWLPLAVRLFPGSNGGDLYDFVTHRPTTLQAYLKKRAGQMLATCAADCDGRTGNEQSTRDRLGWPTKIR